MHLTCLDLFVVIAYFVGLSAMGIYFSRRQTSEESYFLGNRQMPWVVVGVSVMATLVSTLTYLSMPGEMIRYGIGYFSCLLAYIAVIPFVTLVIIPALMRLPVTSVYEYFETRYSGGLRTVGAGSFVLTRIWWMGIIIFTASMAVSEMTGWRIPNTILILGAFTTFYTTIGGVQAVIWADFIQGLLLVGGAIFIPIFIGIQTWSGPLTWWGVFAQGGHAHVPLFSFDPTVRITVVGIIIELFCWHACTHSADQIAAQRYLSTPSVRAAQRSVWVSSAFTVTLLLLLMLVGLALFYYYFECAHLPVEQFQDQTAPQADRLLPRFIATQLPSGLGGLLLAAVLAAAMASLSSGINAVSSVVTTDFVERFGRHRNAPRGLVLARGLALLTGIGGISTALVVNLLMQASGWNLVELMERVNHLFVAPLGGVFLIGVLSRRVGTAAAFLGFIAGFLTSVLVAFSKELFGLPTGISFTWIIPSSLLVTMAVAQLSGLILPRPSETQLRALQGDRKRVA